MWQARLTDVHITQRPQRRRCEADRLDRRSIPEDIQRPALEEDGKQACKRVHHEEHNRSVQEAPVRPGRCYAQEEERNRYFDEGDRPQIDGLGDEVEFQANGCPSRLEVGKVAAGTISDLRDNDAEPSDGQRLQACQ